MPVQPRWGDVYNTKPQQASHHATYMCRTLTFITGEMLTSSCFSHGIKRKLTPKEVAAMHKRKLTPKEVAVMHSCHIFGVNLRFWC